ncbi:MAG: dTMP kinase [Anaerolineaceae bacterium]|nr:dTMP kinase [Anaerolineaceae bacterium]
MFVTLEGPDGSGKTSHIPLLVECLCQRGYRVLPTREPGGTEISDQVKDILKSMQNKAMHPRTEILLFCSARAQLVEEVIRPALLEDKIVLSDRYADSTLAYQGYGHGVDLVFLRQLLDFATGRLWPDFTLLLDIDAEQGLKRRRSGGDQWDRLDDYELSFHERVRQGYHDLAQQEPGRWQVVNANQPFDQVQAALQKAVLDRLKCNEERRVHGNA